MGGGTAAVQAIGLVAAPVLTRLYVPADFGVMAAFSAVTSILVLAATLRYDAAIPIAPQDEDAARLLVVAACCTGVFSFLVLALCGLLPQSVFALLSDDLRFHNFRWFMVIAVLGGGLNMCLAAWVTRKRHFLLLSSSRAYQSLSSVSVQLGGGLLGVGLIGLILGAVANLTSGFFMLLRRTVRDLNELRPTITIQGLRGVAAGFKQYPSFTLWTSLLNLAGRSAPTIMMSVLFGAVATGLYALGLRVIAMPSALISGSVSRVFLSRIPEATVSGTLGELMEETTARLSGISAYMYGTLAFFGPDLFRFVFGPNWAEAGLYVRYLAPWLFLGFIFSPQTPILLAMGRQAAEAACQFPMLLLRVGALFLGTKFGTGPATAVALFAAVSALTGAAYFAWTVKVGGASFRRTWGRLVLDALVVSAPLGIGRLLFIASGNSVLVMVLAILATGLLLHRRIIDPWRPSGLTI